MSDKSVEKMLKRQKDKNQLTETERLRRGEVVEQQRIDNVAAIGRVLDTEDGLIAFGMILSHFGLIDMNFYEDDDLARHGAWLVRQMEMISPGIYPKLLVENRKRNEKYRALIETGGK